MITHLETATFRAIREHPNQPFTLYDVAEWTTYTTRQLSSVMMRLWRCNRLPGLSWTGSERSKVWFYDPDGPVQVPAQAAGLMRTIDNTPPALPTHPELLEYIAKLEDGSLLLKGDDNKIYRAKELS